MSRYDLTDFEWRAPVRSAILPEDLRSALSSLAQRANCLALQAGGAESTTRLTTPKYSIVIICSGARD